MRRLRSSTFFTLDTSKYFTTGVSSPALKSPRVFATPIITDVTVLVTDCIEWHIGAVIVRVQVWVKVVVQPGLPLIQRPFFPCLFAVNLDVIMGIGVLVDFLAAANNHKAVHQQKLSPGKVFVQSTETLFV